MNDLFSVNGGLNSMSWVSNVNKQCCDCKSCRWEEIIYACFLLFWTGMVVNSNSNFEHHVLVDWQSWIHRWPSYQILLSESESKLRRHNSRRTLSAFLPLGASVLFSKPIVWLWVWWVKLIFCSLNLLLSSQARFWWVIFFWEIFFTHCTLSSKLFLF